MDEEDKAESSFDLNELNEYKKLTVILENELENKESKMNNVIQIHEELKLLHDQTRQECNELNQRLLSVYSEKADNESKHQIELKLMKKSLDKQIDIYEQQILKLSSNDPESLKLKLSAEVDMKYKQEQYSKALEVEELNTSLKTYKRQHELLQSEYQIYKQESIKELNAIKELHQSELKDILQKIELQSDKQSSSIDMDNIKRFEAEIELLKKEIIDLNNEIESLRKEKEALVIEKNEIKLTSDKEIDKERFYNKILIAENERLTTQSYKLQDDITDLKKIIEEKELINSTLLEEKASYESLLNEQSEEYALFKGEMIQLRNQLEVRDKEIDKTLRDTQEKAQMKLYQELSEREGCQKQIEDLTSELNEVKINFKNYHECNSKEFKDAKRDYIIIEKEKNALYEINMDLKDKFMTMMSEYKQKADCIESYERDYMALQEKYRALAEKELAFNKDKKEYESKLNESKKEIRNLNSYIATLKDSILKSNGLKKKYNELLEKKKYYKSQCKKANDNIIKLIGKLHPNEREIETLYLKEHEILYNQSEESGF